ncbi:MAG: FRG domain-containing protein [Acidobacteria bacterium]|nr:FRG domain-containing protein [Acidobacteriota bacterium]MBI3473610.1 FRG domain-containing protein [Candidatus Solibacter usitatus]
MTPYEVIRLDSWDDFLRVITYPPYADWAFRGQRDERWRIYSALSRYLYDLRVDPALWIDQEERILRIFKRKAHNFLTRAPALEDDFEWLALMQHHGAPTRLLDFTWSPYVAAFFALERAAGDAAIWAINPAQAGAMQGQLPLFPTDTDPTRKENFRRFFLRQEIPFVWVGEPQAMNRRLSAQSGTFAIPGNLNQSLEEILGAYPDPRNTLVKLVLPAAKIRKRGLRELYRMKITRESLFPDLDGLARSLAYELEFHWAYDPHTGGG